MTFQGLKWKVRHGRTIKWDDFQHADVIGCARSDGEAQDLVAAHNRVVDSLLDPEKSPEGLALAAGSPELDLELDGILQAELEAHRGLWERVFRAFFDPDVDVDDAELSALERLVFRAAAGQSLTKGSAALRDLQGLEAFAIVAPPLGEPEAPAVSTLARSLAELDEVA